MALLLAQKAAAPWLLRPASAEGVLNNNGYANPAMVAAVTGRILVRTETAPRREPELTAAATGGLAVKAQAEVVAPSIDPAALEMWEAYMEAPVQPRPKKAEPPKERVINPTFSDYTQDFTHPGVDVGHYSQGLYASWLVQD